MSKCPSCENGTMTIKFTEHGKETKDVSITCVLCDGVGEVSQHTLNTIEKEKKMWCKCIGYTDTHYVPDTKKMKHHWKCNTCKKIKQIG